MKSPTPSAIVSVVRGKPVTTTETISKSFGRQHKNVLASFDKLIESGTIDRLEIKPISYLDKYGREQRAYEISERAALIAMPFIGGRRAEEGQVKLVDGFLKARKEISRLRALHTSEDWQQTRLQGKEMRRTMTDTIAVFVQYAKDQGSQGDDRYFMNFTKSVNKALFFVESIAGKALREHLDGAQLATLAMAEKIVERALSEGMAESVHYKAVFRNAAERVKQFASLVGQSSPGLSLIK